MSKEEDDIVDALNKEYDIESLIAWNDLNVSEKLQSNGLQTIKFEELVMRERIEFERQEELLEKLVGELYHKYRFNHDEELTSKEIEKYYIPKDPKYLVMKKILRKQKIRLSYFEYCARGLKNQSWAMKNHIENKRY